MLSQEQQNNSDIDWKVKYEELADELDIREQDWTHDKQNLLKSVLRLTFLYQGNNDLLDKKLSELKEKLKQTGKTLPQRQIDDTINAILTAKKDIDADKSRTCQLISNVVSLLLQDNRFINHTSALQAVQRDLETGEISPISKLKQVNKVIAEINNNPADEKQHPQPYKVFLKRLAENEKTHPDLAEVCHKTLKLNNEKELLTSINYCIDKINAQGGSVKQEKLDEDKFSKNSSDDIEHLLTMLDWITMPGKSQKKLNTLKAQLEENREIGEIGNLLRRLSLTINNAFMDIQAELSENERFLTKVTNQLNEITLQVADIQKLENESFTSTTTLNEELDKQFKLIRNGVNEANTIDTIKSTINQRIEVLQDNMDQFISVEHSRKQESDQQHQELIERIGSMEKETDKLRKCIEEERNKALTDALTGIGNRLAFDEHISCEYKRWKRYRKRLSLCMIDIDKFKGINDTYGHKAGDIVLKTVAEKCMTRIRESDFFCRYGGEEFALILPETSIESAKQLANALRETVENCAFQYGNQTVPITISCGLAEFKGKDNIDTVFNRADKALYMAKDTGRNRCVAEYELRLKKVE
ncbi:MAG: diguanylate cyclase [Pseudomonadota bacterium]